MEINVAMFSKLADLKAKETNIWCVMKHAD